MIIIKEQQAREAEKMRTMMEGWSLIQGLSTTQGQGQGQTAQIIRLRAPPAWTGQRFEAWRKEIEKWYEENRSP